MQNKKVFLGGTCGTSIWRKNLIPQLNINHCNPIVEDWTKCTYEQELKERQLCDYCLYVITAEMEGFYAIAEVVDGSHKRPKKTIFCYLKKGFSASITIVKSNWENDSVQWRVLA